MVASVGLGRLSQNPVGIGAGGDLSVIQWPEADFVAQLRVFRSMIAVSNFVHISGDARRLPSLLCRLTREP